MAPNARGNRPRANGLEVSGSRGVPPGGRAGDGKPLCRISPPKRRLKGMSKNHLRSTWGVPRRMKRSGGEQRRAPTVTQRQPRVADAWAGRAAARLVPEAGRCAKSRGLKAHICLRAGRRDDARLHCVRPAGFPRGCAPVVSAYQRAESTAPNVSGGGPATSAQPRTCTAGVVAGGPGRR